jgi:hypothetical protein
MFRTIAAAVLVFPEPVTAVPGNATLRERTRALVAARLDQSLPNYLKND